MTLKDKTLFISGGSRGVGLAIATRAARDGANVALIAKTAEPHLRVPKTCVTWADALQIAVGSAPRSGVGRVGLGPSGGAMIVGLWA